MTEPFLASFFFSYKLEKVLEFGPDHSKPVLQHSRNLAIAEFTAIPGSMQGSENHHRLNYTLLC